SQESKKGEIQKSIDGLETAQTNSDSSKKALKSAQFEVDQLPDNEDIQKRFAAAKKTVVEAQRKLAGSQKAHEALVNASKALAQKIVALEQSAVDLGRQAKAKRLIFEERTKEWEKVKGSLAGMTADVRKARDEEAKAKSQVDDAKKRLASAGTLISQKEDQVKAAEKRVNEAIAKEKVAKEEVARAKRRLASAEDQIDKWEAAEVNVVLHEEEERLENYRERLIGLEGRAKTAIEAHESAEMALAEAKKTLQVARSTIKEGQQKMAVVQEELVETGLAVLAARLANDLLNGEEEADEGMPLDEATLRGVAEKAPELESQVQAKMGQAEETMTVVAKAQQTAKETPSVIAARAKQRGELEAAMQKVLRQIAEEEEKVDSQSKAVDALRAQYEKLYAEWDAAGGQK
ncbi:MAG: hypothetical protein AAF191_17035, partial [Verrucomicrobiota bacterium]